MDETNRRHALYDLIWCVGAVPRPHVWALLDSISAMDESGYFTATAAEHFCEVANKKFGSHVADPLTPEGMRESMLWESFDGPAGPRYRVAFWWLGVDLEPSEEARSYVYFVRAGDDGPVKIGRSIDVPQRAAALQTANHEPLRVLARVPGGSSMELMLHRQFQSVRLHGEWFRPTVDLLSFIREVGGTV